MYDYGLGLIYKFSGYVIKSTWLGGICIPGFSPMTIRTGTILLDNVAAL